MRLCFSLLLSLLAATPPAFAQASADQFGWRLGAGVDAVRFGAVAVGQAAPGVRAELRPTSRPAFHLSVSRTYRPVELAVEAGWAGGHVEVGNELVSVEDRTAAVSRYRLGLGISRGVAGLGGGSVSLALVPAVDLWTVEGEHRLRAGIEVRVGVRADLGGVELENRIGVGISGNPIVAADLGEISDLRGLRALSVGLALRCRI